ncbi:MAG: polysaccharide export protein [Enterobacterales bacterium]|nr:polysaccharide export protein [Enterobacterales bacterium]
MKNLIPALLILLCSILTACSTPTPLMDTPSKDNRYWLGEGDQINIAVAGEPDMTMRFMLDNGGTITFPYIGQLRLIGKTPEEVSAEIAQRLKGDYLHNPMVTVTVSQFRNFFILGEVEKPDAYPWQPGLTVEKALALGGGFTDRADKHDLSIRLSGSNELLENVDVRHSLRPGDTVIVGMSFF